MKKLIISGTDAKIEIDVWEGSYPEAIGTRERNWIKTTKIVEIPGYTGNFQAEFPVLAGTSNLKSWFKHFF